MARHVPDHYARAHHHLVFKESLLNLSKRGRRIRATQVWLLELQARSQPPNQYSVIGIDTSTLEVHDWLHDLTVRVHRRLGGQHPSHLHPLSPLSARSETPDAP